MPLYARIQLKYMCCAMDLTSDLFTNCLPLSSTLRSRGLVIKAMLQVLVVMAAVIECNKL